MTAFAKHRTRPVRHREREPRRFGRLFGYIGIAVGFGAIGFVASLSTGTPSPVAGVRFSPLAGRPSAIAVTRDALYVADDQDGSVRVVDPATVRERRAVHVGANPVALTIGDGSLFVGHASGDVTRIALDAARVTGHVHPGGSITGLAFDGHRVWAADLGRGELEEINATSLRVVRRVHGVAAVRVVVSGHRVFATTASDELVRYDPVSGEVRRVRAGNGPIGLAADGTSVWVANSDDASVVRVNASSMRVGARVRVGHGPVNLAIAHGVVWVTNDDDRTLSRIDARSARVIGEAIGVAPNLRGAGADGRVWFVGTDPSGVVRSSE